MTWYQSDSTPPAYRQLISSTNLPTLSQLLNCEQFCTQLVKHGNQQILNWIQNNYVYFLKELITRCLVLPLQSDSQVRKYRQPSQSINLVCSLLDVLAIQQKPTNLVSSINNSINSSILPTYTNGKLSSPQIISFIIDQMFQLYLSNKPDQLPNTMIPAYFSRIFETLHRSYGIILAHNFKSAPNNRIEKLLTSHMQFEQICKFLQTILVVHITESAINCNIQMSGNLQNSINLQSMSSSHNYAYELKYRILLCILNTIKKQYTKMDVFALENMIGVLIELVKNNNVIFEGVLLSENVVQTDFIRVIFRIAYGELNAKQSQFRTQCQSKALELLKYCIHITSIDRTNFTSKLREIMNKIMEVSKITILDIFRLELINQWFQAQFNLSTTIFCKNQTLTRSSSASLTLSMNSSTLEKVQPSLEIQNIFANSLLIARLIDQCVSNAKCNIFHQRVANFISNIFKSQNIRIIQSIFRDNDIIKKTICQLQDFKANPYFGYFIIIIQIYTTRRVQTTIVNEVIEKNKDVWNNFYNCLLEPHVLHKLRNKLGEMENVTDSLPLDFTSTKIEQKIILKNQHQKNIITPKIQFEAIKTPTVSQTALKAQSVKISQNPEISKQTQKIREVDVEETMQPICLLQNSSKNEVQQEKESFQSFLQKKMSENSKLIEQRKKRARTPTKVVTNGQKKMNKWALDENSDNNSKPLSADDKIIRTYPKQVLPKLTIIRLKQTKIKPNTKERIRYINKTIDPTLIRWMQKIKGNVKKLR